MSGDKALVITPAVGDVEDTSVLLAEWPGGGDWDMLNYLYALIECSYVEAQIIESQWGTLVLWFDEEGMLNRKLPNLLASQLWWASSGRRDVLVGPVVVTGRDGGDTVGLDEMVVGEIVNWLITGSVA